MSWLARSASFEYLCYGWTAILIYLNSFSAGTAFRRLNLTSIQTLDSDINRRSRAERVISFCIISDVFVRHKKYIIIHHSLFHIQYFIYFSVVILG